MNTIMMHFATGPTHENAGGIFIGKIAYAMFILYAWFHNVNHVGFFNVMQLRDARGIGNPLGFSLKTCYPEIPGVQAGIETQENPGVECPVEREEKN